MKLLSARDTVDGRGEEPSMLRKSVWHMMSTEVLTRIAIAAIAATLGSLGVHNSSPVLSTLAGISIFLLIVFWR